MAGPLSSRLRGGRTPVRGRSASDRCRYRLRSARRSAHERVRVRGSFFGPREGALPRAALFRGRSRGELPASARQRCAEETQSALSDLRAALQRPAIAIAYIGAIMTAFVRTDPADSAALRCADAHLATLYTAWKPSDFAHRSLAAPRDNAAGDWTNAHLAYLTNALGAPPASLCP